MTADAALSSTTPQPGSIVERLVMAADRPTGVRFVGHSVAPAEGDGFVPWAQIHDDARVVGAALQARGLVPGDHVAILGPTSRSLITIIQGCWLAGCASMVLPLPMRMGSLDAFIESTRSRTHAHVRRLWDLCTLPDFRKHGPDAHFKLVQSFVEKLGEPAAGKQPERYSTRAKVQLKLPNCSSTPKSPLRSTAIASCRASLSGLVTRTWSP